MALIPRLDLSSLDRQPLDPLTKGLPFDAPQLTVGEIGRQGWNVLRGDMPLPLAVIRQEVVRANSQWMSAFTAANDLVIAPHGKTTMSPALFLTVIWPVAARGTLRFHVPVLPSNGLEAPSAVTSIPTKFAAAGDEARKSVKE